MKEKLLLILAFFCLLTICQGQKGSYIQATKAENSPAIFASSVSIAFGVKPTIVLELLKTFKEEGLSQGERRKKAVKLIANSRALQGDISLKKTLEIEEVEFIETAQEPYVIQLLTESMNSPAVFAKGDVQINYWMSEDVFWGIFNYLEAQAQFISNQQLTIDKWEEYFKTLVTEYFELEEILSNRNDTLARQAKALIQAGKIREAREVMRTRVNYSDKQKRQLSSLGNRLASETRYDLANFMEGLFEYDSAEVMYKEALALMPRNVDYLQDYGNLLIQIGQFDSAIWHIRKAKLIDSLENGRDSIGGIYNNLGFAYFKKGKLSLAFKCFSEALAIDTIIYGFKNSRIAKLYSNIGMVNRVLGNIEGAISSHRKALAINSILGNNSDLSRDNNNLGVAYTIQGVYTKAIHFYKNALYFDSLAFKGVETPYSAGIFNNLGNVYYEQGLFDSALVMNRKALQINVSIFDTHHPRVSNTYMDIGAVLEQNGKPAEALPFFNKALEIDTTFFGIFHFRIARIYNNTGGALRTLGRYDEALLFYYKALQIDTTIFGGIHIDVAKLYNNIGLICSKKGNHDNAISMYHKALKIDTIIFGQGHPEMAKVYGNIGAAFFRKKSYDQANKWFHHALTVNIEVHGPSHPEVATILNNKAVVYVKKGELDSAILLIHKALLIDSTRRGANHYRVGARYGSLGTVYTMKREFSKALIYQKRALEIEKLNFEETHPRFVKRFNNIASIYDSINNYSYAIYYYQNTLESLRRQPQLSDSSFYKKISANIFFKSNDYGQLLHEEKKWDSAAYYFQIALRNTNGIMDSTKVVKVFYYLSSGYKNAEQCDSALVWINQGINWALAIDIQDQTLDSLYLIKSSCLADIGEKTEARVLLRRLAKMARKKNDISLQSEIKRRRKYLIKDHKKRN